MLSARQCTIHVLIIVFIINGGMSLRNRQTLPFPDNDGNVVDLPINCHVKREAFLDLPSQVRFHLYRRIEENYLAHAQIKINESLPDTILKRAPTKILIHGFINSLKANMIQEIKNAYLDPNQPNSTRINVIAVDWGDLAGLSLNCYIGPMKRTRDVGKFLGEFIDYLVDQKVVDLESVHLIGHSLGAHVAGIAGKHVTRGKLARITGLDPAGVLYGSQGVENKLDKADAIFVDVIHSDTFLLGYKSPCGHVDFYPHGGSYQPGCIIPTCSHSRAHIYFRESVYNRTKYMAYECDSLEDVSMCYAIKISNGGCNGCNGNLSNFMGESATSNMDDTLYFSYPPVPGSEGGGLTIWNLWGFPTLLGAVAFSIGAVVTGAGMWGWRKFKRCKASS